jgi:uncharacterized cupredoxin-like copper-binding protein
MHGLSAVRRPAAIALSIAGLTAAGAGLLLHAGAADAAGQTLHLRADAHGKMRFSPSRLTARAGHVTLVMVNPKSSGMPHGIAVEGHGVDKDGKTVAAGGTSRVSVTLKKGTYEFYCPVRGHKAAGMEGKLVVR